MPIKKTGARLRLTPADRVMNEPLGITECFTLKPNLTKV
jgi:hypothetical protein